MSQPPLLHDAPSSSFVPALRRAFPALEREIGGLPVAYFDGPGGTQVPSVVADAMSDYLLHHNANTHWRYPTSRETDDLLAGARQAFADFLAAGPDEIAFGANMTTITFHVARALGRVWSPGDEVVVTDLDHQANVAPWQALARERGIVIRRARFLRETGEIDWSDLERQVTARTKLLAIGAASNALGTVTDVRRAADLAHAHGAAIYVDAVHYAPHALVDVAALDCDFLACSAYKFYGPHVGVLYGRREWLERLDVPKLDPAPDHAPDRLETGTQNHEGIVGAARAVDFLADLAAGEGTRRAALQACYAQIHGQGEALVRRLWDGLESIPGVRPYGPPPGRPRTPTVSFAIEGCDPGDAAEALARRAVFVSHGDFYASTVIEQLGRAPAGLIRAGCACYTTAEEVDRLLAGVEDVAGS